MPDDEYQLSKDIAEALTKVLQKHGYFYDKFAGINEKSGYVGAWNNDGCEVKFQIIKPFPEGDK